MYPARNATLDNRPAKLTLKIVAGDSFEASFLWLQTDGENRTPIDLTGLDWETYVSLRDTSAPIEEFEVDDSQAAAGIVRVSMVAAVTGTFQPGSYWWRIRGITPAGEERSYLDGPAEFSRK